MFPAILLSSHAKKFDICFIKYVSKVAKWIKLNVLVVMELTIAGCMSQNPALKFVFGAACFWRIH